VSGTVGRTITVSVTAADIDNGIRGDCWKCPIALALWRATGEKCLVGRTHVWPLGDKDRRTPMPEAAVDWIRKFDRAEFPKPMEFELTIPVPVSVSKTDSVSQTERTIAQ
jgi:hypothetical protein